MQIMIDIETLSTEPNAAIASIGAVAFEFSKGVVDEFYQKIDITDSIKTGGAIDGDTLKWIFNQSSEMIAEISSGQTTVKNALNSLFDWVQSFDTYVMWANSPSFDLTIIRSAALRNEIDVPWMFWHERDYRTFISYASEFGFQRKYTSGHVSHNALEDSHNQAHELINAYKYMQDLKDKADDRDLLRLSENTTNKEDK